jgi:hypothetical protein
MQMAHKNYYLLIIYIYSNILPFVVIDDFSHSELTLFSDLYIKSQICCFFEKKFVEGQRFFKKSAKIAYNMKKVFKKLLISCFNEYCQIWLNILLND